MQEHGFLLHVISHFFSVLFNELSAIKKPHDLGQISTFPISVSSIVNEETGPDDTRDPSIMKVCDLRCLPSKGTLSFSPGSTLCTI